MYMHTETRDDVAGYRRVSASYGLRFTGGQVPYFTVTGEAWTDLRRRDADEGGAIHDVIVRAFPHLSDLIALHLSDVTGAPMHAEANGWYWFSDYDGRGIPHVSSEYASLTPQQRAEHYLRAPAGHFDGVATRDEFRAAVNYLRPQWKREADSAIVRHNLTP